MLLIGSLAAKLRGYLPPHRHGLCGDVDLFGSAEALERFVAHFAAAVVTPSPWVAGKFSIAIGAHRVEFDTNPLPSVGMTYCLGDNAPVAWLGMPMVAISPETMLVQKLCIRGLLDKPKHEADIAWLRPRATITRAHLMLYRQLRREARTRFGKTLPPPAA